MKRKVKGFAREVKYFLGQKPEKSPPACHIKISDILYQMIISTTPKNDT
ncbi:MAG: hypothetical protein R2787_13840 [Saprospiraceae bacterium]